jgi:hypothetical protein
MRPVYWQKIVSPKFQAKHFGVCYLRSSLSIHLLKKCFFYVKIFHNGRILVFSRCPTAPLLTAPALHTLLRQWQVSAAFFFRLSQLHFIPSRADSYKVVSILYRDVSLFVGHVFPLRPHSHNVPWFSRRRSSKRRTSRENVLLLPRWVFGLKAFIQLPRLL